MPESTGSLCSQKKMSFCANGLKLDEEGKVSGERLWKLLVREEAPQGLTHVELEMTPDGSLWLNGWAGMEELKRTSLNSLGIQCEQGKLVPVTDGGPSLLSGGTGPMSLFGMGIGGAWGNLQFVHAEDGAMLIRIVDHYAGTIMVAVPVYIDTEDWYRFAPVLAQRDWMTCPGVVQTLSACTAIPGCSGTRSDKS